MLQLPLQGPLAAAAPRSGVHLGAGQAGPVALRLFRRTGTRIAVIGTVEAAQLIAVRAATAGAGVLVMTRRDGLWSAAVGSGPDSGISAPGPVAGPLAGRPGVIIDDRPEESRSVGEVGAGQCRVDVRQPQTSAELASFANADAVLLGRMSAELAAAIPAIFGVAPAHPAHLTSLADGTIAVVRRGALDYVTLDPTPAEAQLLRTT
ncbi:MAG: hypothetical protein ABI301_06210 [Jatrophihabitantaceae bacterium]